MHEELRMECLKLAQSPATAAGVQSTEQIIARAQAFYNFAVPQPPLLVPKGTVLPIGEVAGDIVEIRNHA